MGCNELHRSRNPILVHGPDAWLPDRLHLDSEFRSLLFQIVFAEIHPQLEFGQLQRPADSRCRLRERDESGFDRRDRNAKKRAVKLDEQRIEGCELELFLVGLWHWSPIGAYKPGEGVVAGKGQNIKNQNVKSPKVDWKFEKDQNVKSQIRLLTFWSFLTS